MAVIERARTMTPWRWRDVPLVLMYHTVDVLTDDPHRLAVSPRRFVRQLATLRRLGLRGVGVGHLLAARRAGRSAGLVGITFDDGYAGVVRHALPAMRRFGCTATVFVVADRIGAVNDWDGGELALLDGPDLAALAGAGWEIGAHGARHVPLAGLGDATLRDEVTGSRDRLAALLDAPVDGFCYPYGSMDAAARAAVTAAGYRYACAVDAPRAAIGVAAVPRIYVGERDGALRLTGKRVLYRARLASGGRS
ncbi:polysaccharide deacetylase family protein [Actinocatenispora sera]|uniref:Polysaccharide deacetylase n=1 Tax=Actinocatenispora sera TaxID=390989 RepID=A0A810L8D9_9ACTN|nr:polysaccharide deacetylase family protein [Actinocatenispora sera]BCJ31563.1 polysaccharide deacetylase [Actinocatenispora sera]